MVVTAHRRSVPLVVLAVILTVGITYVPTGAASLSPSASAPTPTRSPVPTASPRAEPGTGGLVPGVLAWESVGPPYLRADRALGDLVAWDGGFAMLERRPDDDRGRIGAVWRSSDGRDWHRSRVPRGLRQPVAFVPFRGGLVIATDERDDYGHFGFALGFWRSSDGIHWRRAGALAYQVPDRLEHDNCQVNHVDVAAADDRLLVYAALCWDPCCGIRSTPVAGSFIALAAHTTVSSRGVVVWASRDGKHWARQRVTGLAPEVPDVYGIALAQAPDGLLAIRLGRDMAMLRSTDGRAWERFSDVPARLDTYGQLEFTMVEDAIVLVGESYDTRGYGNGMHVWRIESGGSTSETLARQPAYAHALVVVGPQLLVVGEAWGPGPSDLAEDDDEAWAWIIGSRDDGRTWPDQLAWTGGDGSCLSEAAASGDTVVMLACPNGRARDATGAPVTPAIWVARVPVGLGE